MARIQPFRPPTKPEDNLRIWGCPKAAPPIPATINLSDHERRIARANAYLAMSNRTLGEVSEYVAALTADVMRTRDTYADRLAHPPLYPRLAEAMADDGDDLAEHDSNGQA